MNFMQALSMGGGMGGGAGLANGGGLGGSGIGPLALLMAAQGLLAPGPSAGARFSAGMGGLAQGMGQQQQMQMHTMQLKQMQRELEKQKLADEAIGRLTGDGSDYEERTVTGVPEMGISDMTMDAADPMSDMIATNPSAFVAAKLKRMMDPNGDLPEAAQTAKYFATHPDMMQFDPRFGEHTSTNVKDITALYGKDWLNNPKAVQEFKTMLVAPRTSVSVASGENMAERGLSEISKSQISDMQGAFSASINTLPALARMRENLRAGLKTGATAPIRSAITNFLTDDLVGMDAKSVDKFFNAPSTESADYQSASTEMTLGLIKALGANPSNADVQTIKTMIPQMRNNPQAAMRIIDRIYSKNATAVSEYGSMLGKLPKDSPNAAIMRSAYDTRMETYKKYLNRLNTPPGAPAGTTFAYEDFDGNSIYQTPDGQYMKFTTPGGP